MSEHCDHCEQRCKGGSNAQPWHYAAQCSSVRWDSGNCPYCSAYAVGVEHGAAHERKRIREELAMVMNAEGYAGMLDYLEDMWQGHTDD